jgi:BirA family transcriptional regulator, biotin operon repressor / biotin---[acetyl-CoA-carboxylase] ligase
MRRQDQATRACDPSSSRSKLGDPRLHLRRTVSTNDCARELALAGAPHGTLVTADEQTAGRGRHGRRWSAPPHSALLMSLLLRWPSSEQAPALLPLAAAVAVCDIVGPEGRVKWPNDVVVRKEDGQLAKLAGVLIEGRPQQRWLILGIGLNVAVDLAKLPADVQGAAATMEKSSREIETTLEALLVALERRLGQPAAEILLAWRSRDALRGMTVTWKHSSGIAAGISDRGMLLVRREDGSLAELDSGEVTPAFDTSRGAT